jgi:6-phosphogluconolactonase
MNLVELCATRIASLLNEGHCRRSFAISGGSSPKPLFARLAQAPIDWSRVDLYWVDERCVPPTDEQSNYRMAREHLIVPAGIPEENVHRIATELPPGEAAADYLGQLPDVFDVIHLGLGPDTHTASLFPGDPLIEDRRQRVAATYVHKFEQWRVTLCPRVLLEARHVVVFAPGSDKAGAVRLVREGELMPLRYPAQLLRFREHVDWFTG